MPKGTMTFLWGDEIISYKKISKENEKDLPIIKMGSLVWTWLGKITALTRGTFLIEKMPDPVAIWTRGKDKHTEWGGKLLSLEEYWSPIYLMIICSIFYETGEFAIGQ